jgi:hypothetical protein
LCPSRTSFARDMLVVHLQLLFAAFDGRFEVYLFLLQKHCSTFKGFFLVRTQTMSSMTAVASNMST